MNSAETELGILFVPRFLGVKNENQEMEEAALVVLQNVLMRLEALVKLFDEECRKGNPAFVRMKEEGHQQFYRNEIQFIKENMLDWI